MRNLLRAVCLLTLPVLLRAQTGSSGITGRITDPSGAAVPAVAVAVTNEDSGAAIRTTSNESGVYRVPSLVPGVYRLEAEIAGFDKFVRTGLTLNVAQVLALDLTLQIGQANQTVNIEVAPPLTDTQSSSVGQLVDRKMVAGLPMPNRAATSLAALAPGVVMINTGEGAENYPVFSISGGRARNQNFTLDGGNVTNAVGLTRPQQMTSLPMDAMQEFRVISNNYAAEFGHSAGGVVTLSTRSGTNQFHGSVFEFLRNSVLDARNFFASQRPPLRLNQYGGSFGGPIRKDKTHFFASWEQTRQLSSAISLQTVPSLAQRNGDFTASPLIYDPATTAGRDRQPFPGNQIPTSRFDPVAGRIVAYWPLPNRPGTATGANNYGANNNSDLRRDIFVGKLDHQLSAKDQFTARYYLNDSFIANQGAFGNPVSDPDANTNDARIQSILGSHTHVFRPSLVNEFRFTFLQRKFIAERFGANQDLAGKLGLSGVSGAAFPIFTVPGYVSLSNEVARYQTPIRDTQFQEALSWFRGRHAFKAGGEHRRGANNEIRDRSSSGNFGISPLITSKPGVAGTGNSLASLLLGEVNSATLQVSDKIPSRAAYWAWFLQDDWRATDRLTLNIGLRWEAELPRQVEGNLQNSFDPSKINPISGTPGVVTFSGTDGVPRRAFRTDTNNFGPRAGFAYRLPFARETVIRAGAGIFYGPTVSNSIGDVASLGFSTSASFVVSQADTFSALQLRNGVPAIVRPPLSPAFGAVAPGQRPNTAVGFFNPGQTSPISYQYNFTLQREIARETVVETGYLANVSHHLTANDLTLDQVAPSLMGGGDAQSRRPFPQFSNVSWINPSIGNSTYHAGFVKVERRFRQGASFLAHYTFSKFIDDVAAANEFGDPASYMDAYNRRLDKSLSGSDIPHRFVVSGLYEVPRLKTHPLLNTIAGAWKAGAFVTLQSGPPFTVVTAANTTNAFPAGPLRPDLIADPTLGPQTLTRWFNTAAFRAPDPFRFGNAPRSGLRAARLLTVDATLAKEFSLTERLRLDLRGEFYNLLNHPNFDLPGHTLGNPDFGVVLSARAPRTIQAGLRLSF